MNERDGMKNPGFSPVPRGTDYRQKLAGLLTDWISSEHSQSSSGVNDLIGQIAETLDEVSQGLPYGYRYAFVQVLGMELMQSSGRMPSHPVNGSHDFTIKFDAQSQLPAAPVQVRAPTKPKKRRQVISFPGTFDLRADSELLDLGYTTHERLTERERRYMLVEAYKAAPGAGGRTSGTEYWGQPGTPQRLKAIADHLHHLCKYRVDRRTPDRAKLGDDLAWLKQVLYWEGCGVVWPK